MPDAVIKPKHYQAGGLETIEVIRAKLGPQGFGFYCEGNVLKYLTRWRHKAGVEDLRKAHVYLEWLIVEARLAAGENDAGETSAPPKNDVGNPITPMGEALAQHAHDEAEATNVLNTCDTTSPQEG